MGYPTAENISSTFESNHWLIGSLIEGMSHEDSIVQPPFEANCMNWVVGHIIRGRNTALMLLEAEPVFDDTLVSRYKTGSQPVTGEADAVSFEKLVGDLNLSQERITAALAEITPEGLAELKTTDRGERAVGQHLSGLAWHETFHTGQLDLLRSLALQSRGQE
ncbi:MAG: DinB family protein [Candidatus Promineifilaceae bacterium]